MLILVLTSLKYYIYYTIGILRIQWYAVHSANEFRRIRRNPQTKITTVNSVVIGILF